MKNNYKKAAKKYDNLFSKYRSMIWVQLLNLIILIIFLPIAKDQLKYFYDNYRVLFIVLFIVYILFFNLGYVAMQRLSKQSIIFNFVCILMLIIVPLLLVIYSQVYDYQLYILIAGIYISLIPYTLATVIGFIRANKVFKYIGYKETLFVLSNYKFKRNNKEITEFNIYLKDGHSYIEVDGTRRKTVSTNFRNLNYSCATIFGRRGHISFDIQEFHFEYEYKSSYEDGIMFALAYNISRVSKQKNDDKRGASNENN